MTADTHTRPTTAVTDAEAIEKLEEWRRNCLDMIESHRAGYPPLLDFEIERVERSIAVYDLLLALARDGQRFRALEPDGYAVISVVGNPGDWNYGTETTYLPDRNDASEVAEATMPATIHPCYLGPAEPVTPSAEKSDE